MKLFVSAEDELSRAVIAKMANVISDGDVQLTILGPRHGGFGYIKKSLRKFCNLALRERVFVLTDLDRAECAPTLRASWLDTLPDWDDFPECMVFCVAVREVEAWLMADALAFASFFSVSPTALASDIESTVTDPKEFLVATVKKSTDRSLREAVVPASKSNAAVGFGYNQVLSKFVAESWLPERGASSSKSLNRAINRLETLLGVTA